jgi:hypothetical protein
MFGKSLSVWIIHSQLMTSSVRGGGGLSKVLIENWKNVRANFSDAIYTKKLLKNSAAAGINNDKNLELLIEV